MGKLAELTYFTDATLQFASHIVLLTSKKFVNFGRNAQFKLPEFFLLDELGEGLQATNIEENHPKIAKASHFALPYHKHILDMSRLAGFSQVFPPFEFFLVLLVVLGHGFFLFEYFLVNHDNERPLLRLLTKF